MHNSQWAIKDLPHQVLPDGGGETYAENLEAQQDAGSIAVNNI